MRDSFHSLKFETAIAPVVVSDNTAQVGAVIDRAGFESVTYCIMTGTLADVGATFAVLMEHGDESDLSDAAAVPDEDLIGTEADAGFTFADDGETRKLGYRGHKQFTRLTVTPSANAGSAPLAVVAVLGHAHDRPVA